MQVNGRHETLIIAAEETLEQQLLDYGCDGYRKKTRHHGPTARMNLARNLNGKQ